MLYKEGSCLIRKFANETLLIEPWLENSLRIRSTKNPHLSDSTGALLQPEKKGETRIHIDQSGWATIENGKIKALVDQKGKISFYNQKGEALLEEFRRARIADMAAGIQEEVVKNFNSALNIEPREFTPIIGGDYALTVRFESDPDEKLYGMGQYQQDILNVKYCRLELAHRNSQASVPFALSSKGYGFLWNNPAIGSVTFGKNVTEWNARSTKELDYWITAGDTPAEIEEKYADATGKVPMMPEYAMGFWQCKLRYQTQEELLNVARGYKERNLPIDVIVIDFFHWTKQGEYKFDPKYWPDPEGVVRELESMGIQLMVSVWPTIDKTSEHFHEMNEKGLLVRTERGVQVTMDFLGNCVFFDPTNPEAREYLWKIIKKNYYDKGIHIFWLDEAEPEYTVYDYDNYRYYEGSNLQVGNKYPVMYAKTFFDGMKAEGQEKIINLVRSAWAGSQRYGALVWSGDIDSSFQALRNQLAIGLNMGIAGIPWWTTDIGGFHGGVPSDPAFRELLIRWFQFGAFSPVFRLHGDREPHSLPLGTTGGGMCPSGADNEVWSFGEEAYEILRKYLNVREQLKPYIRDVMTEAHEKGTPVIRPLFYDFPEDKVAWDVEDSYMFGPSLLVAPILEAGQTTREVYLPAGTTWTDAWAGQQLDGGQRLQADAPLAQIPLYVRGQAKLPFQLHD